jgi:SAM-dependent methyltransferase
MQTPIPEVIAPRSMSAIYLIHPPVHPAAITRAVASLQRCGEHPGRFRGWPSSGLRLARSGRVGFETHRAEVMTRKTPLDRARDGHDRAGSRNSVPAMADFISAPFYDLLQENGHVPEIRRKLPPLLDGVRRSVLEIGAGTGLITTSLADWTPAEIFALEPSAGMRAVLLSRLSSRPELLKRVTVLPFDALSVDLDEPVEAVVMINVMYALEPDYRKRLWPVLAAQLAPAGLLIFTWRAGGPPALRPLQELDSRQVGRHTYTVLSEILESDEEAFRARYLFRVTEGEKVISEEEIIGSAYRPVWDVIQRELVSTGFTQTEGAERLLAWRLA